MKGGKIEGIIGKVFTDPVVALECVCVCMCVESVCMCSICCALILLLFDFVFFGLSVHIYFGRG